MLFNSLIFIVFLGLFFAFWGWSKKQDTSRWIYLCVFSFAFYAWWDWRFLFLILFSGLVDYFAGILMQSSPKNRKLWLGISLVMNIGSLSIFKYSVFFASTIDLLLQKAGINSRFVENIPEFALILPVGISFYTFQSMSYTIDIYKNQLKPTKNIFHFFAYLSMFPQLVAGPIIRAKDLLKQLSRDRKINLLEFWNGLKLITVGFFQKIVLADNIGVLVNRAYNDIDAYNSGAFWWLVAIGFSLQIYFDFSGYSLIARGIAKWMGFHFKMNFNHPYLSKSLKQFWRNWHISLSTWFKDYVYIPLGGTKNGKLNSYLYMWITMLISGIWHGAAFTFIIWGAIHAFFLSFERVFAKSLKKVPTFILYFSVLIQVIIAWVFFRSSSVDEAIRVLIKMVDFNSFNTYYKQFSIAYFFLILAVLFEFFYFLTLKYKRINQFYKNDFVQMLEIAILIIACLFYRGPEQAFIYFQF